MSAMLFTAANNFMLYMLYIIIGGITVTMIKGELTLELLMIDDESENTTKSRRKAKKSTDTFK